MIGLNGWTFKNRVRKEKYGVIYGPKDRWAVVKEADALEHGISLLDILPKNYKKLDYATYELMRLDKDILPHWKAIIDMVAETESEILEFILRKKVPLKKLLCFELKFKKQNLDF